MVTRASATPTDIASLINLRLVTVTLSDASPTEGHSLQGVETPHKPRRRLS
jgi:hypothetical protein